MARTALEEKKYELIKSHIISPDESPLHPEHQELLDRVVAAAKILDKNPLQKNAMNILQARFPHISKTRAFMDVKMAQRLFNTIHNFDYDFWQAWAINDIVANIQRVRTQLSSASNEKQIGALSRVIAMEHANLIKAIGEKPPNTPDPKLTEKHDFFVVFQQNNTTLKIDLSNIKNLPEASKQEINRLLFSGQELSDTDAEQIMKS